MVKRLLTLFGAVVMGLSAQDSQTVIENDQVKVLKVKVEPHKKTRLHQHAMNRVMIYFEAGLQNIDSQDGKRVNLDWKAGEVKWSPAGSMHVAEITSNQPVTIVELELKKPAKTMSSRTTALDPVSVDPKHYKVEFENNQVRVLRVKIGPHETAPMHEHTMNRVVTYLTDQDIRVTGADGKAEHVEHKAGEVSWGGAARHQEENLSDKPFEVVVVELKG